MKNGTTICHKHDTLLSLFDDLSNSLSSIFQGSVEFVRNDEIKEIEGLLASCVDLVKAAKEDGQSMENALLSAKEEVSHLAKEIVKLEAKVVELEIKLEDALYQI